MNKRTKQEFTPASSITEEQPAQILLLNDGSGGPEVRNPRSGFEELHQQLNSIAGLISEIKEILNKHEDGPPVRTPKIKNRKAVATEEEKVETQTRS